MNFTMKDDLRYIIKNLIYFIVSGLLCAAVLGLIFLDINYFKGVPERKFVECAQEVFLVLSSLIFFYLAWKKRASGLWLVGGLLACMFIRELDCSFDKMFHGAWLYAALITAILCIFKAYSDGVEGSVRTLADFIRSKAYSKMSCGLLIVLVYSRLIGYKPLWQLVMKKQYLRNVKTIVEEGTELFGYAIIFLAAVEYACYLLNKDNTQN